MLLCPPACGRPSRPPPALMKRIVGGRSAEPGLFPWQVLLSVEDLSRVPEDRWFGSGALLSESWVLTAAHVLRSQRRDASVVAVAPEHVKVRGQEDLVQVLVRSEPVQLDLVLQVFLGLHDARDKRSATNRSVERIILHPNFQPDSYDNDIALLRLSQRAELNQLIQPVCLPQLQPQVRTGGVGLWVGLVGQTGGWGCGWGCCGIWSSSSDLLQVPGPRPPTAALSSPGRLAVASAQLSGCSCRLGDLQPERLLHQLLHLLLGPGEDVRRPAVRQAAGGVPGRVSLQLRLALRPLQHHPQHVLRRLLPGRCGHLPGRQRGGLCDGGQRHPEVGGVRAGVVGRPGRLWESGGVRRLHPRGSLRGVDPGAAPQRPLVSRSMHDGALLPHLSAQLTSCRGLGGVKHAGRFSIS